MISYRKVLSFSLDLNIHFFVYLDSIFGIYSQRSTEQIRLVLGPVGSGQAVGSPLKAAQLGAWGFLKIDFLCQFHRFESKAISTCTSRFYHTWQCWLLIRAALKEFWIVCFSWKYHLSPMIRLESQFLILKYSILTESLRSSDQQ